MMSLSLEGNLTVHVIPERDCGARVFLRRCYETHYVLWSYVALSLDKIRCLQRGFFRTIDLYGGSVNGITLLVEVASLVEEGYRDLRKDWVSPEGRFVDWEHSHTFQNLDVIEEILEDVKTQIVAKYALSRFINTRDCREADEYRFVVRVLYREIEEERLRNPASRRRALLLSLQELPQRALLLSSIDVLKERLCMDRLLRARDPQARLNNFASCKGSQSEMLIIFAVRTTALLGFAFAVLMSVLL